MQEEMGEMRVSAVYGERDREVYLHRSLWEDVKEIHVATPALRHGDPPETMTLGVPGLGGDSLC